MADSRIEVLKRLDAEVVDEVLAHVKRWLGSEDTHPLFTEPVYNTVFQVAHVWRVREKISRSKGHTIVGAEQLLAKLQAINPRIKLEQRSFSGNYNTGNIFFEKVSGKYVGVVMAGVVKKPAELLRAS